MGGAGMSQRNKDVVRRLVDEVFNAGRMEIVDLIAEGDTVVGRFTCSATHTGEWLGHAPTGRRFKAIGEVTFFRLSEGRIVSAWGIEDNLGRLEQLGLR